MNVLIFLGYVAFAFFAGTWSHETDLIKNQIEVNGIIKPLFYKNVYKCEEIK